MRFLRFFAAISKYDKFIKNRNIATLSLNNKAIIMPRADLIDFKDLSKLDDGHTPYNCATMHIFLCMNLENALAFAECWWI